MKGIIKTKDGAFFVCKELGGPGSGNFDHAGIPGQQGGSAPGGGGGSGGKDDDDDEIKIDESERKKTSTPASDKFEASVKKDLDKAMDIINSGKPKAQIIKELKDMKYFIDSDVKKGDLAAKVEELIRRRYVPNVWRK